MKCTTRLCGIVFLLVGCLHADLVELTRINPHFRLDVRYATTNNFTGRKVYPSARCFLQEPAALALDKVQQKLEAQGLGLKIFDAYRPLSVQKIFWAICPDENYVANPAKGSRHNRGCSVDVTLVNLETGDELVMPSGYDDFSEKAGRNYVSMTPEVRENCKLLKTVMKQHGFRGVSSEWWHFDYDPTHTDSWKEYPVLDIDIAQIAQS